MALTDIAIRNAKPRAAAYKLADGGGLYVLITPLGAKYWRLKYRFAGKEKLLAIGVYGRGENGTVPAAAARAERDRAKAQLRDGVDPGAHRKATKRARRRAGETTFEPVALAWWRHAKDSASPRTGRKWSEAHAAAVRARLEHELFPALAERPIAEIEPPEILDAIRAIEARGALELASKTLIIASQVFRYAVGEGLARSDPTRDLRGNLKKREVRHYARLAENELPAFLRKLDSYVAEGGSPITQLALELLILTWVRTAELRGAKWPEFDVARAQWRIPAERMKGRIEHISPLSRQALAAIEKLRAITGDREFVFPNEHDVSAPMSENTVLFALYRMGYRGRATGHGFRATASTIMNGQHRTDRAGNVHRLWHPDWIEEQLAHREGDVRGVYNHAKYLPERARMMQAWADYLDAARAGGNVVPMKKAS